MKALLVLQNGSDDLLSGDPHLSTLSSLLSRLKSLLSSPSPKKPRFPPFHSVLPGATGSRQISILAGSIGSELLLGSTASPSTASSPLLSDDDKSPFSPPSSPASPRPRPRVPRAPPPLRRLLRRRIPLADTTPPGDCGIWRRWRCWRW
ncbi:putative basic proline-rich protein-like [Iris pallida]|uniref:Basic proline-rich protein-like n=1 Tax=Iris pallida TaxID=29817 RepID=A0AAX6GPL5_IRIPA|nr:putative basic proline-rich protein-like [Iris pallida]